MTHEGVAYLLIDTPGLGDTKRSDYEVLRQLVDCLSSEFQQNRLVSGVIYLHPVSKPRVSGSETGQIRVLKELCGPEFYKNVVLGTTFWGHNDRDVEEARERELFSTSAFLGDMKDLGAKTVRVSQDRGECLKLLKLFPHARPTALKVQNDLAQAGGNFDATGAAAAVSPELHRLRLENEKQKREAELREKERGMQEAQKREEEEKEAKRKHQEQLEQQRRENEARQERLRREEEGRQRRRKEELEREEREWVKKQHEAEMWEAEKKKAEAEAKRVAAELANARRQAAEEERRRR